MLKIRLNKNEDIVRIVKEGLKANDNYCPCILEKSENTKCMCKEFKDKKVPGLCHCGLYEKY